MPTKRTLSGTYITPQDIRRQISVRSSHSTPGPKQTSPVPADAKPHVEYLSKFDLAQVTQWLKLYQELQRALVDVEVAVKSRLSPISITQNLETARSRRRTVTYYIPAPFATGRFEAKALGYGTKKAFTSRRRSGSAPPSAATVDSRPGISLDDIIKKTMDARAVPTTRTRAALRGDLLPGRPGAAASVWLS